MAVPTPAISPAGVSISVRSYLTTGVALMAVGAIAFTPLVVSNHPARPTELPQLSTANVDLTAVITSADIEALVANLNTAMNSVSSTITSMVAVPGQTLGSALNSAVAVNNNCWNALIAANGNRVLDAVLTALKTTSHRGLSQLADTVGSANDTLILTTGEVTNILTLTLTGSLGTALQAVANVVANPLRATSYTGLLTAPLDIAGLAMHGAVTATKDLGTNGLTLAGTLVTGVTAQISNSLAAVNALLGAAEGISDFAIVDGVLVAVQGIVSAPVTAAVAGINGVTSTITIAAGTALTKLSSGAAATVGTWLGDGTTPGAMRTAINVIGAAALTPASYTKALSVLIGAGMQTRQVAVNTASSLMSIPFRAAADLTNTAADMITSFSTATATAARGILEAAGLPSIVYNLPYALSGAVNLGVKVAAGVTSAGLNTIAAVLDISSSLSGALTAHPQRQLAAATLTSDAAELENTAAPDISDVPASATADTESSRSPKVAESSPTNVTPAATSTADTTSSTESAQAAAAPASATSAPTTSAPVTPAADESTAAQPSHTATATAEATPPEATTAQGAAPPATSGGRGARDADDPDTSSTAPRRHDGQPTSGRHAAKGNYVDHRPGTTRHTHRSRDTTSQPGATAAPGTSTGDRHARPKGPDHTERASTNSDNGGRER